MSDIINYFKTYSKIWTQESLTEMFDKIITEIESFKKNDLSEIKIEENKKNEEWLTMYEFISKYPFASAEFLSNMRTNCQDPDQKFFKSAYNDQKYPYLYNPIETFRFIMKYNNGKTRIQNKLRENNFYGFKLE